MKNKFLKFFIALFAVATVASCAEHDEYAKFEESLVHFANEEETASYFAATSSGSHEILYGSTNAVASSHTVNLVYDAAQSTAVPGTDFTIVKGTDELTSGEATGSFVIEITAAAGIAGKHAVFNLESPTLAAAGFKNEIKVLFSAVCPSNLQGAYTYSTTNYQVPGGSLQTTPLTGSGQLTVAAQGGYSITDAAFGVYIAMWSPPDNVPATGIRLVDTCGKLSFAGVNQYGDSWSISNVVVNGNQLTFDWASTYNEIGTTTLTRTDGTNWPANLH